MVIMVMLTEAVAPYDLKASHLSPSVMFGATAAAVLSDFVFGLLSFTGQKGQGLDGISLSCFLRSLTHLLLIALPSQHKVTQFVIIMLPIA